ncbi:SDR family NAD(P)-dependent oxidoreductase [Streptomyces sp. SD11]|uniref:SDR family NAD(P)-dependent oxidoreductase n=1 Tax=Streptomyces sp. SD11 TaxID=3452209 RepID=UPI003F8A7FA0
MSDAEIGMPIALVTGANKGIGPETVRRLIDQGFHVYLGARSPERGRPAADSDKAQFLQVDVTSDESVQQTVAFIQNEHGRLDVLVNNAGIGGPRREPEDYTADDMTEVLMTNVVGYMRLIHACLPLLEKSSNPRIVNVSSGLGSFALFHDLDRIESRAGAMPYAASKAAINMMTARMARLLPQIHINAADPGQTATDLSGDQGHSIQDGTDAILAFALADPDGPSGTYADRAGELPW